MTTRSVDNPIRGIIFDFDGTLIGGMSTWISALESTLSHFGIKATNSELEKEFRRSFTNGVPGSPWRKIFSHRFPGKEDEAWSLFFKTLERVMADIDLSPNVRRFLKKTRQQGVRMGIVTFRTRESVEEMLSRINATQIFDIIIGAGDTSEEKPSPQPFLIASERMNIKPEECLVIGDEVADILGGKRAGMQTIGVLSGASNREMLEKAGAGNIVRSLEELANILRH